MKDKKEEMTFNAVTVQPIDIPYTIDYKGCGKWVKYGQDNKLPTKLYNYYNEVSNLQSIIQTFIDYICGNGFDSDKEFYKNSIGDSFEDIIKKIVEDYCIFGGYSLEIIRNAKGEIADILYQDIRNVRVNEDFNTAYLSNEWGSFYSKNVVELPLFNDKEKCDHFIYYYNGGSRGWYATPFYFAALKSIETLKQIRNFHLNNLLNNFSGNAIVTFCNGVPSKSVQDEIFDKLKEQYTGTDNASKIFVTFSDSAENAPKVERLESDNFGELYKSLSESCVDDIYQACRINKMLLGANVQTGFSKEEFIQAADLFNMTVILPMQRRLSKSLKELGINVEFRKYTFE